MCDEGQQQQPDGAMQMAGGTDWKKSEAGVRALDQPELGSARSLTSKLSNRSTSTVTDLHPDHELDKCASMDTALPMHWGGLSSNGHKVSKSSDSQDFEFSMCGVATDSWKDPAIGDGISPADDLFYKGQLLPLHSAKRLQMLQKLSSPKQTVNSTELEENSASAPIAASTFHQTNGVKHTPCGDEGYLKSALVNSRSCSFHSQGSNNFWESDSPGELDSGDSSSSRDSSGSSQDACSGPGKQTLPKFPDRIPLARDGAPFANRDLMGSCTLRSDKRQRGSWLKSSLRWKAFFGLKKFTAYRDPELEEPRKDFDKDLFPRANKPETGACGSDAQGRAGRFNTTYFSAEQTGDCEFHKKEGLGFLEHRGGWFPLPVVDNGFGSNRESVELTESAGSKGRDGLHKYFIIGKPSTVKSTQRKSTELPDATSRSRTAYINARSSFSGNLTVLSSVKQSSFSSVPPPKAAGLFAKGSSSRETSVQETVRCRSLAIHTLSGNLRTPSFSRNSKVSADGGQAAGGKTVGKCASPHQSEELNSSPSSVAELQSAIQGAIAHCKQSQSTEKK